MQTQSSTVIRKNDQGLANLLDRISKTEGPLNPNDRAVARIYAGNLLKERELRGRTPVAPRQAS
jgi:hypothetical protein